MKYFAFFVCSFSTSIKIVEGIDGKNDFSHQYAYHTKYSMEMGPKTNGKTHLHIEYGKLGQPTIHTEIDLPKDDLKSRLQKLSPRKARKQYDYFDHTNNEKALQLSAPTYNGWLPFDDYFPIFHHSSAEDQNTDYSKMGSYSKYTDEKDHDFSSEMNDFMRDESEHLLRSLIERFSDLTSEKLFDRTLGKPDLDHFIGTSQYSGYDKSEPNNSDGGTKYQ